MLEVIQSYIQDVQTISLVAQYSLVGMQVAKEVVGGIKRKCTWQSRWEGGKGWKSWISGKRHSYTNDPKFDVVNNRE